MSTLAQVIDRSQLIAMSAEGLSSPKYDSDFIAELLYPLVMKKVIIQTGLDPYRQKDVRISQKITISAGVGTLPTNVALECLETAVAHLAPAVNTVTSISAQADTLTITAHEYWTGMPFILTTTGIIGGGLEPGVTYWAIRNDANNINAATTQALAFAGSTLNLSSVEPVGTTTLTPSYTLGTSSYVRDYVDWSRSLFSLFYYWTTRTGLIYVRSGATTSLVAYTAPVYLEAVVFPVVNSGTIEIVAGTILPEDLVDSIVAELASAIRNETGIKGAAAA